MRQIFVLCSMFCASVLYGQVCDECHFLRGDANCDGVVNLTDVVLIANYVSNGGSVANLDAADANDDGIIDLSDSIYLSQYLYNGGGAPACPFPSTGLDCTADNFETCCSPPTGSNSDFLPDTGATHSFLPGNWDMHDVQAATSGTRHGKKFIVQNASVCNHDNTSAIGSVKVTINDSIGFTRSRLENAVQDAMIGFDIDIVYTVGAVCHNYASCTGVNRLLVKLSSGQLVVTIQPKAGGATKSYNLLVSGQHEYRYTRTTGGNPCKLTLPASNIGVIGQGSNLSTQLAALTVGDCDEWKIVSVELINVDLRFERLNGAEDIATTEKIEASIFPYAYYGWCTCP